MSQIGKFAINKSNAEPGEIVGHGYIKTLAISFTFDIEQAEGATGDNKPALRFHVRDGSEIGSGWKKKTATTTDGVREREFYSLTFDDPSFAAPMNLAAWPNDQQPGQFNIIFSR